MQETQGFDIKKYMALVSRRKYLFIAVSLLVLSVLTWGSFFVPEKYEATSKVFIEESVIKQLINGVNPRLPNETDELLSGLQHTMLSKKVLKEVINRMDLDIYTKDEKEMNSLVRWYASKTEIISQRRENLFIVSFRGQNPKIVQDYVNTLISVYVDTVISSKREDAYGASKFLAGQIDYYKDKIDTIETEMADFRRKEGIYLASDESSIVRSIKDYTEQKENVEMDIKKLNAKEKKIRQQLSGEEPFTLALIENSGGDSLPARLKLLEQRFQSLLTQYTENYPEVIKVKAEMEMIKKLLLTGSETEGSGLRGEGAQNTGMSMMNPIYQQLKEELLSTESEIDSLEANKEILSMRIKRAENELRSIPKNKKVLANFERDRDTYHTLYQQLLAKLGRAEVNEQVEVQSKGETFKIVERAGLPRRPVSPDRVLLILLGVAAGIGAGVGAVLLREKLDSSVRDVDRIKTNFNVKILAVIPEIILENDIKRKQRLDRNVYAVSALYLIIIGGIFVREVINRFS